MNIHAYTYGILFIKYIIFYLLQSVFLNPMQPKFSLDGYLGLLGLGHGACNCGRSSVSVSSYFSYWDRIFNISLCLSVCPTTLLTSREKTANGILFKLGIYIHGISESILFIFSGPKNDGVGVGGQMA